MRILGSFHALLLLLCIAQYVGMTQATRPGPMLRGGTVILLRAMPRQQERWPDDGGNLLLESARPWSSVAGEFDEDASSLADRMFDGPSVFGPPLLGLPSMFSLREADPFAELLSLQRPRCRHAGSHGSQDMMQRMAAARFGPHLLSSLLEAAQAEDQEGALLFGGRPMSQIAASGPHTGGRGHGHGWGRISQHAARAEEGFAEERQLRAEESPSTGDFRRGERPVHTLSGATWRFKDFVKRPDDAAQPQTAGAGVTADRAVMRLPFALHGRTLEDGTPRTARTARLHASQLPSLSWDIYSEDGQLNGGVLVFVLLSIACIAVWARLLVLWCTSRTGPCLRRGESRAARTAQGRTDAIKEGLEEPLLNPLAPEAPITGAQQYQVEVAATHAAPPSRYVTLQYVPLKGEQQ